MMLEIGERRRAEAELRAADDRYRTLLTFPGVVYIWEVDHGDEDAVEDLSPSSPTRTRR